LMACGALSRPTRLVDGLIAHGPPRRLEALGGAPCRLADRIGGAIDY
jgi:hypothetical protein